MPNITRAVRPLVISGETYQASELRDRDYEEIDEYIRSEILEDTRRVCDEHPSFNRQEMLMAAIKCSQDATLFTMEGNAIISRNKGMARLAWQMCKTQHDIKFDTFYKTYKKEEHTAENIERTWEAFRILNIRTKEKESEEQEVVDEGKK